MKQKQCTSSPDTAGDFLPTSSSDTRQLSLLSGIPMPAKSSENEQQTDGSPTCECGKGTSECLIHPNTPEKWTAFMRDSLAKTLALPENKQALARKRAVASTVKSSASLAWFDPSSCSWKTSQQSFLTDSEQSWQTLPRSGMTLNGFAYELPIVGRITTEIGGGYWLTPRVVEVDESVENFRARMNKKRPNDRKNGYASLSMQVKAGFKPMWPTPDTRGFVNEGSLSMLAKMCDSKEEMFAMWHQAAASKKEKFWPTPRANSAMAATITPESAWDSKRFPNLETMVGRQMWPTPAATDYKGSGKTGDLRDQLDYAVERGATKSKTYETNQTGGQLNPTWVEWLMGFPIGFTVSKDWVTPKSRSKQQQPTDSLGDSDAP